MPHRIADRIGAGKIDRSALQLCSLTGLQLMEGAGAASACLADELAGPGAVTIFCGNGKNGGDGLVAARHLMCSGRKVTVVLLGRPEGKEPASDTKVNLMALLKSVESGALTVLEVNDPAGMAQALFAATGSSLVIDAVLGTGAKGAPEGLASDAITAINSSGVKVLSLDMPSGCPADGGPLPGIAVRAYATITFAALKAGLFSEPGASLAGRIFLAPIGIPDIAALHLTGELLDLELAGGLLPERQSWAHKGDLGKVGLIAGSVNMPGAAVLAAKGALKGGAGLCELFVPEEAYTPILGSGMLAETMVRPLPSKEGEFSGELPDDAAKVLLSKDAIAIGPGIGRSPGAGELVRKVMKLAPRKLIMDADALWFLAKEPELAQGFAGDLLLTPHGGELERLLPEPSSDARIVRARECSALYGACVAFKGPGTVVAEPSGRFRIVHAGNSLMATPGSGDVLTGLSAAYAARMDDAFDALSAAAYVHSLAGDLAARGGVASILAGDIAASLPEAASMVATRRQAPGRCRTGYSEITRAV